MKLMIVRHHCCLAVLCLAASAVVTPPSLCADEVALAVAGEALLPIRIADDASGQVISVAGELRELLTRMAGAEFVLKRSLDGAGIRLRVETPPELSMFDREDYSIRTANGSVTLIGKTDVALEHAVWDLLHRLGFRQFFPGPTWEVVPQFGTIRVDIDVDESPDYRYRRIWYGYGMWGYNEKPYADWCRRNRMGGSVRINSGHAYGRIIRAKQAVFDRHAEFYALLDGKRNIHPQAKLCVGNPRLRRTVVAYAREFFRDNPDEDCISVDPSDGGGWCECDLCREIGSPSDRALLLANEVADAVSPKLVGMYAYNYHSAPPSIRVRPNVCINTATAFIKGGRTIGEIITGWSKQGATLGIREYYSVNTWDRDLPGAARGSNLDYLANTIPHFHAEGARFMNSESSDNWGCNGLGYFFASRVLWDIEQASRRAAIVEDFLDKSFGAAKEPMHAFFALVDGNNSTSRLVYDDLLARMYRHLEAARQQVRDKSTEQARIDDLILYTRHVDLFDRYRNESGAARQQACEAMLRHAWRIRATMMVHSKALYRDVPARDRTVAVPADCTWLIPEDRNPWKSNEPYTRPEIVRILQAGLAQYQPVALDFEPRQFSDDLDFARNVLRRPNQLPEARSGNGSRGRGKRAWFTKLTAPGDIVLHITGGLIAHYRDRGNVQVTVFKAGGASATGERQTLVASDASVPPDGKERTVRIPINEAGLYRIELDDGMDMTQVTWPEGQPMSWKLSLDDHPRMFTGRWSLYFYVPAGTKRLGLYADTSRGRIAGPGGKTVQSLEDRKGQYISVNVPPDSAGKFWQLNHVAGKICLLTVPAYAARSPGELLLPVDAE